MSRQQLEAQGGRSMCCSPPTANLFSGARTFPRTNSNRSYKRSPMLGANNAIPSPRPRGAPLSNSLRLSANSPRLRANCGPQFARSRGLFADNLNELLSGAPRGLGDGIALFAPSIGDLL